MFVGTAKAIFHTSLSGVTNAVSWVSLVAQLVKNLPAKQETLVGFLGQEDPLEKGMATHFSILAWRIPWRGTWQSACSSCVSCLTSDVITTNPVPQARILKSCPQLLPYPLHPVVLSLFRLKYLWILSSLLFCCFMSVLIISSLLGMASYLLIVPGLSSSHEPCSHISCQICF